jgi:hypothetical protein
MDREKLIELLDSYRSEAERERECGGDGLISRRAIKAHHDNWSAEINLIDDAISNLKISLKPGEDVKTFVMQDELVRFQTENPGGDLIAFAAGLMVRQAEASQVEIAKLRERILELTEDEERLTWLDNNHYLRTDSFPRAGLPMWVFMVPDQPTNYTTAREKIDSARHK